MSRISLSLREFAKKIAFRHFGIGKPRYPFGIEPILLGRLLSHIERIDDPDQSLVEAGVASGMTTRFLVEHLRVLGKKNRIYAIDTFAGFIDEHAAFEVTHRAKSNRDMQVFKYNDYNIWKRNFQNFPAVVPIKSDIGEFDFSRVAPIGLFLLDVDLYLPTKMALENVVPHMSADGAIYVDDVQDQNIWDGAYQAFVEFTRDSGLRHEFIGRKSGIIYLE